MTTPAFLRLELEAAVSELFQSPTLYYILFHTCNITHCVHERYAIISCILPDIQVSFHLLKCADFSFVSALVPFLKQVRRKTEEAKVFPE